MLVCANESPVKPVNRWNLGILNIAPTLLDPSWLYKYLAACSGSRSRLSPGDDVFWLALPDPDDPQICAEKQRSGAYCYFHETILNMDGSV